MKHNNIFGDFIKRTAVMLSVMLLTAATAWAGKHPVMHTESIKGYAWGVELSGWTYDPDAPEEALDIVINFYTDAECQNGIAGIKTTTSVQRDDVNAMYNLTGKHGFNVTVYVRDKAIPTEGTYYVEIFALDKSGGDDNVVYRSSAIVVGPEVAPKFNGNSLELTSETEALRVGDGCVITGTGGSKTCIVIEDGATVTLAGIDITTDKYDWGVEPVGIKCLGNATIILKKGTTNYIRGGRQDDANIQVGPENTTLTIKGYGTLVARSFGHGACIGGKSVFDSSGKTHASNCGNIVIEGGFYDLDTEFDSRGASHSGHAACIGGSGFGGKCGSITITGGNITAWSGFGAAAIGTGRVGSCGDITITGGNIYAIANSPAGGAAIGGGLEGNCGNISISGITSVSAVKYNDNAPYCIGPGGANSTCGTLTLWGQVTDYPVGHGRLDGPNVFGATDIPFTVSFNANGGSGTMEDQNFYSNTPQELRANTFTLDGKYLSHWSTMADGDGYDYTDRENVTNLGNVTLYAQWHDCYTIHFEANGGTGEMEDQQITSYGQALNANAFTHGDYFFVCWNTKADGSGTSYADGEAACDLGNVTLYAQWHAPLAVHFDANGGTGEMEDQIFPQNTNQKLKANAFTRQDYTFLGWNTMADGSGTAYNNGQNIHIREDMTLYAQWHLNTYYVSFDANGGTGKMDDQELYWATNQKLTPCSFTREGYTFIGWNTKADGSGDDYVDKSYVVNMKVSTLYAQWMPTTYTITYVDAVNGKENVTNTNPTTYNIENDDITLTDPTRNGFIFDGWTYEGQDEPTKKVTISQGSYGDKTYTAHWTIVQNATLTPETGDVVLYNDHTVTGTGGTDTHVTIKDGATVTLAGVTITDIPNDVAHSWAGITCEGDATIILANGTTNKVKGGIYQYPGIFVPEGKTLTIQGSGSLEVSTNSVTYWEGAAAIGAKYGINCGNIVIEGGIISAHGGSYSAGIGGATYGSCGTITIRNTVTSVTATAGANCNNAIGSGFESSIRAVTIGGFVTGNITQNPYVYKPSETTVYSVSFNANGGEGTMEAQTLASNIPHALTANAFTRTNYIFMGWNTAADGSGTGYTDGQKVTNTGNVTLYAQWSPSNDITLISSTGYLALNDGQSLSGTGGSDTHIVIANGATVTLKGANITDIANDDNHKWAGISCLGDATIILADGTTNSVKGGHEYYPGIRVPEGKTLTIRGTGTLNASSNGQSAGIGAGYDLSCGNIVIEGGIINATASGSGAGIGGGNRGKCGNITITGGTITATGSVWGAGIGGVQRCGNITITDGVTSVTAIKGSLSRSCIGAERAYCGTVTIDGRETGIISMSPYTYKPSETTLYTITFNANGGEGTMDDQTVPSNIPQALTANAFTRTYYEFIGWNTAADGSGDGYSDGQILMNSGSLTLYAQWKDRYLKIIDSTSTDVELVDNDCLYGTGGMNTHVTIADGATVTLNGVNITSIPVSNQWAGITCLGDATIILSGENDVKGGYNSAGITVQEGKTLTIRGDGSLTATGYTCAAGIGSGYSGSCGNIVIEGGTITAVAGKFAAAIGCGYGASSSNRSSCGNITIASGVTCVIATKISSSTNMIGTSGSNSTCGTVTIDPRLNDVTEGNTRRFYQPLALVDNADNTLAISDKNNQITNVVLSGRTIYKDGDWNTLCLPFDVDDLSGTPLEGATVMELNETTSNLDSNGTLTLNFEDATSIEAGKPYLVKWALPKPDLTISTDAEWETFANNVNDGTEDYANKKVKLDADINVSEMVGTSGHPFRGTFDGNGHTLTLSISDESNQGTAPFRYISGATIMNVKTIGTVTGNLHCAGLVGFAKDGTNSIQKCVVAANVVCSGGSHSHCGGILGHGLSSITTISDCLFSGSISGTTTATGIIYGWGDNGKHTIENCLSAGTYTDCNGIELLRKNEGTESINNCYRKTSGGSQGTDASGMNANELATTLGDGWEVVGDNVVPKQNEDISNPVFKNVTIDADASTSVDFYGGSFMGTYSPVGVTVNDKSNLFLGAENKLFYPNGANNTDGKYYIKSCRAYFHIDGSSQVKEIMINFGDEEADGIGSMNNEQLIINNEAGAVYNLSGQKLSKPQKGINIINGKKLFVK